MISNQSLTCPKGASLTFEIDMDTGSDLTGATAQWALCESWFDQAKVYLTKTGVGDGLFIGQDAGVWKITVNLAPTDTLDIPSGLLYHDCKVLLQSGDVEDVANGPFSLDPSVNILLTNAPITRNLRSVPQAVGRLGQGVSLTVSQLVRNLLAAQTFGGLGQSAAGTVTSGGMSPVFQADFTALSALPAGISLSRATTATYFDASGVLQTAAIDAPRFDHAWNGSAWVAKGLLIEEQRTNFVKDSDNLTTANWSNAGMVPSVSGTLGSDGATPMTLWTSTAGNNYHTFYTTISVKTAAANEYQYLAVDLKRTNWNYIYLNLSSDGANLFAVIVVDLSNNTITETKLGSSGGAVLGTPTIDVLANGIVRVGFIATIGGANTIYLQGGFADSATPSTTAIYDVDGNPRLGGSFAGTETVLISSALISTGTTPTSHIVTGGSAVTRSADIVQLTGTALAALQASDWSVVAELTDTQPSFYQGYIGAYGVGGANDAVILGQNAAFTNQVSAQDNQTSGINLVATLGSGSVAGPVRAALGRSAAGRSLASNGGTVVSDSNPTTTTFTQVNLGAKELGNNPINGHFAKLAIYSSRLSDADLQAKSVVGAAF